MPLEIIPLFFIPLFSGLSLLFFPSFKKSGLRNLLVFAGSYLFAITTIHILPEIFHLSNEPHRIGIFILLGFLFQHVLELFTSGVEHGHFHKSASVKSGNKSLFILIALCIHAFLEGSLLIHDSPFREEHSSASILNGIILHKIPAAISLMSIILWVYTKKIIPVVFLTVFCLASPAGLIIGNYAIDISETSFNDLFGFVSGNFLHISTTIFIESNPEHQSNLRKTLIIFLGAAVAMIIEFIVS
ncbi:MAG TPA: ZIP family metal transporter [Cyclobacteriaceae bacterium]